LSVLVYDLDRATYNVTVPSANVTLEWVKEEMGGNWYRDTENKKEGWLCPALFEYFVEAPQKIYIEAKPNETS